MSEAIMHIACAADENYAPHCATMLMSLLAQHVPASIHVHFLQTPDFDPSVREQLERMVKTRGAAISFHIVPDSAVSNLPSIPGVKPIMWHKLLLSELLPDHDKVLYLDSDAVVVDNLRPLWETPLGNEACLAAVTNVMVPDLSEYPRELGVNEADYFNSGVLLLSLRRLRENGEVLRVLNFSRGKKFLYWDQDALNIFYAKTRIHLPPRWNCMNSLFLMPEARRMFGEEAVAQARRNPAVIHFEGRGLAKPWHYLSKHPFRGVYLQYRAQTPWPLHELEGRSLKNILLKPLPMRAMFLVLNAEYRAGLLLRRILRRFRRGVRQ